MKSASSRVGNPERDIKEEIVCYEDQQCRLSVRFE